MNNLLYFLFRFSGGLEHAVPPSLDAGQVDWLIASGLGPLLDQALGSEQIPTELSAKLHASTLSARFAADDQTQAVDEILDACRDISQPVTLLKGISISHLYYPSPWQRLMRDIDILVVPQDLEKVESELRSLGYEQTSSQPASYYADHHHTMPFLHSGRNVWLEVHTGLFPQTSGFAAMKAFRPETIAQECTPAKFGTHDVRRLSAGLQLVYIAAHWSMDFKPVGGLIAFFDLIYLLRAEQERLDWDRIDDWLRDAELAMALSAMLQYLQHAGAPILPEDIADRVHARNPGLRGRSMDYLAGLIDRYYVAGARTSHALNENNLSIIWHTLFEESRWPLPVRLPWHLLFPPNNPDRFRLRFMFNRLQSLFSASA